MLSNEMASKTRFLRVLAQEKVPYLVTLLFGSIGWFVTYCVGQINASPTIEYTVRTQPLPASRRISIVDIRNVTRTQRFQNLGLNIRLVPADRLDKLAVHGVEADPPAPTSPVPPFVIGNYAVDWTVPDLQPGWQVHLAVEHADARRPVFRLTSSEAPVRLVESSFETFLVRHEIGALLGVLAVYAGVIVVIVWRYSPSPPPVTKLVSPGEEVIE